MGMSRRQRIIELLSETEVPLSPEDIARILKIDAKTVRQDLPHIQFSIQRKGMRLVIIPQRCKKCGFVFKPSAREASKCPRCHSQWLEPPRFRIVKMGKK
ncbi:MAG: transcriptional regulator [Candidatus Diapherotrites archaeon]|nr:transcriptional regulator [Candidatus Diapherotrites archaeon]